MQMQYIDGELLLLSLTAEHDKLLGSELTWTTTSLLIHNSCGSAHKIKPYMSKSGFEGLEPLS